MYQALVGQDDGTFSTLSSPVTISGKAVIFLLPNKLKHGAKTRCIPIMPQVTICPKNTFTTARLPKNHLHHGDNPEAKTKHKKPTVTRLSYPKQHNHTNSQPLAPATATTNAKATATTTKTKTKQKTKNKKQTRQSSRTRMHTSVRKPKKIIRENNFRYKTMGSQSSQLKYIFQVAKTVLCAPLVATKLRFSIWSWTPALRSLDLYYKVAIFQPELENCTSPTRLALHTFDCPARAENLYFAY